MKKRDIYWLRKASEEGYRPSQGQIRDIFAELDRLKSELQAEKATVEQLRAEVEKLRNANILSMLFPDAIIGISLDDDDNDDANDDAVHVEDGFLQMLRNAHEARNAPELDWEEPQ